MSGRPARSSAAAPAHAEHDAVDEKTVKTPNKGLRQFSKQVWMKVKEKKRTTYNEVADELVEELRYEQSLSRAAALGSDKVVEIDTKSPSAQLDERNVRRRVYDALNVLIALDIINKKKKDIIWVGLPTGDSQPMVDTESKLEALHASINNYRIRCRELVLQRLAYSRLVHRNRETEEYARRNGLFTHGVGESDLLSGDDDAANRPIGASDAEHMMIVQETPPGRPAHVIHLPFVTISTDSSTTIRLELETDERLKAEITLNNHFRVHDEHAVLRQLGLQDFEEYELERFVPPSLRPYILDPEALHGSNASAGSASNDSTSRERRDQLQMLPAVAEQQPVQEIPLLHAYNVTVPVSVVLEAAEILSAELESPLKDSEHQQQQQQDEAAREAADASRRAAKVLKRILVPGLPKGADIVSVAALLDRVTLSLGSGIDAAGSVVDVGRIESMIRETLRVYFMPGSTSSSSFVSNDFGVEGGVPAATVSWLSHLLSLCLSAVTNLPSFQEVLRICAETRLETKRLFSEEIAALSESRNAKSESKTLDLDVVDGDKESKKVTASSNLSAQELFEEHQMQWETLIVEQRRIRQEVVTTMVREVLEYILRFDSVPAAPVTLHNIHSLFYDQEGFADSVAPVEAPPAPEAPKRKKRGRR